MAQNMHKHSRASAEKFPGGGGTTKKDLKIAKKDRKIALLSLFQGRTTEKRSKIAKKHRKIALLSLYLLDLYHL